MKTISVITPCFNEIETIETCYRRIKEIFAQDLPGYRLEHIFSDNASTDGTADALRQIAQADPSIKVIVNARNFGPFRSLFNGLRYATGDAVVVFVAADLQDPPELIPEFVKHWENGIEVVAGARTNREEGVMLRLGRHLFYRILNRLSDFDIPPDVGEFQLIDRKVWQAVVAHDDHHPFLRGIIASVGYKRLIIPYTWGKRKQGVSKNSRVVTLIDQALNGIFSFSNVPLRLCIYVGLIIAALCLIYGTVALIGFLLFPDLAPPGVATIFVATFFLSGLQLSFIGILGEYVTSIHAQVRGGPRVVERERLNIGACPVPQAGDDVSPRKTSD
ncbi:MAG: glycosyltransferase family 2 protein [Paracoccaceae bacterium]